MIYKSFVQMVLLTGDGRLGNISATLSVTHGASPKAWTVLTGGQSLSPVLAAKASLKARQALPSGVRLRSLGIGKFLRRAHAGC